MRRKNNSLWLLPLIYPLALAASVQALPVNGDFSSGLDNWNSAGSAATQNGEAVIGDGGLSSSLFQVIALSPGQYLLEFDLLNELSDALPQDEPFAFYDAFFASLYFSNSAAVDLQNLPAEVTSLFDLDFSGIFNSTGQFQPSSKGGEWLHYSLSFQNNFSYVIPLFELIDLNFIEADSGIRLDNVIITGNSNEIPEPSTWLLLAAGVALCLARLGRVGSLIKG